MNLVKWGSPSLSSISSMASFTSLQIRRRVGVEFALDSNDLEKISLFRMYDFLNNFDGFLRSKVGL